MTPDFSVVVPTYRRPDKIARCLAAVDEQRDAGRLEVVVVEDGGPTRELDKLRETRFASIVVQWHAQEHAGPAAARNRGAKHARGRFLAFTDDDCRPRSDWVSRLRGVLETAPNAILGGHTVNALEHNAFSGASQALVSFITDWGLRSRNPFFASNNVAMSRATFERIGAFDESFMLAGGEDRDFCDRGVELGIEFRHVPEAVIDHDHDLSFTSFLRQHYQYGRGAYFFHRARRHRKGAGLRQSFDPRFYGALIAYPHRVEEHPRKLATSLLLTLSQFPNALGFFVERARSGRRSSP